ncbi:hypothetical protein LSH36_23g06014 [Paralvinella palmiformis]|uniref:CHRD domain-containing protein n=1 Tax=Paralvinella palmiformis TaxID=53620 RepID=A0AAD9KAR1_9ANNE|nr:hypothetical protein LSH36_23g06014 [Paralvinella palmiformis]
MDNDLVPPPAVMRVWIVVLVVTSFLNAGYAARNAEVSRIEFLNEPPPVRVKIPDTPGCVFGDRFYELEQTWHPELLQSGVLYCVLCQCLPNIDKGVLNSKGHVTCRDIKSECPEVTCDNPVLLPEQCCKTCPGQGQQPPWAENASIATYEDMANVNTKRIRQDFIAVLTGFSATRPVATSGVGVAYFSLYQSTLVYSLHLEGIRKPRSLQIIDTHGTVFHSRKLDGRKRQQIVCGSVSWPDVYTGFLKRRRLFIQIDTRSNRDGEIRGEIQPKESLSSDTFASLLTPSEKNGRGGVVLVRLGDNPNTLVFTALIAGIQPADQENRRPTLTFKVGNKKKTFHKNVIHPDTTMYNITMVTWPWNNVKKRIEKFLVAEKLTVHVTLPNDGELVGKLTVRNTCNGFWSIMKSTRRSVHTIGASGMVLIQYQKKGVIRYKALRGEYTVDFAVFRGTAPLFVDNRLLCAPEMDIRNFDLNLNPNAENLIQLFRAV